MDKINQNLKKTGLNSESAITSSNEDTFSISTSDGVVPSDGISQPLESSETTDIAEITNKSIIPYCGAVCGMSNNRELRKIEKLFNRITVTNIIQREAIKQRYIYVLGKIISRTNTYTRFYYFGHFIVTVGSLIVPALLSIQFTSTRSMSIPNNFEEQIYWATWILSLLVTIFNGILTLFGVDKKYILLQIMEEKLKSEGYQFFSMSGRYSLKESPNTYRKNNKEFTYDKQLILFSYQIERIVQKQVEDELSKNYDQELNKKKDEDKNGNHVYSLHSPDEKTDTNSVSNENSNFSSELSRESYMTNIKEFNKFLSNFLLKTKYLETPLSVQTSQKLQTPNSTALQKNMDVSGYNDNSDRNSKKSEKTSNENFDIENPNFKSPMEQNEIHYPSKTENKQNIQPIILSANPNKN